MRLIANWATDALYWIVYLNLFLKKYLRKNQSHCSSLNRRVIVPSASLLMSTLRINCVPSSGTYFQYFSHNLSMVGPGTSSNGNGLSSSSETFLIIDILRGRWMASSSGSELNGDSNDDACTHDSAGWLDSDRVVPSYLK